MSGRRISDLLPLADLLPGFEILGGGASRCHPQFTDGAGKAPLHPYQAG